MSKHCTEIKLEYEIGMNDIDRVPESTINNELFKSLASHLITNMHELPIKYTINNEPNPNGYVKRTISFTMISNEELERLREIEHKYNNHRTI